MSQLVKVSQLVSHSLTSKKYPTTSKFIKFHNKNSQTFSKPYKSTQKQIMKIPQENKYKTQYSNAQ
jgi:hypothetical protein